METRIIVCGIICKDNEILLGKKARGKKPYSDVWHILGGGVEDKTKAFELIKKRNYDDLYFHSELQREIMEESGIRIKNIRNICPEFREKPREAKTENKHGELIHYIFLEYLCSFLDGEPKPSDDISELNWVKKNKLLNENVTKPSEEMYKELGWI